MQILLWNQIKTKSTTNLGSLSSLWGWSALKHAQIYRSLTNTNLSKMHGNLLGKITEAQEYFFFGFQTLNKLNCKLIVIEDQKCFQFEQLGHHWRNLFFLPWKLMESVNRRVLSKLPGPREWKFMGVISSQVTIELSSASLKIKSTRTDYSLYCNILYWLHKGLCKDLNFAITKAKGILP